MAANRRVEISVAVVLTGILAGIALVWSEPSNRDLIVLGSGAFLCLLFIKPEKILLVYLVASPILDQLISFFGGGGFGPQILVRGGLLVLLAFYWFTNLRSLLTFKAARPILMLLILLTVSAIVFAGERDSEYEISSIAKLASWMFLILAVADMVIQGKMNIKWIYRCVILALAVSVISLLGANLIGLSMRSKYNVGEFAGAFGLHTLSIALSIGVAAAIAIATRQRNGLTRLFLLGLSVLVLVSIMRTYVRSGYAIFVSGIFVLHLMLWHYRKWEGVRKQRASLVLFSLVLAGAAIAYSVTHIEALEIRFADFSGSGRTSVWIAALEHYEDYPIFLKLFGGGYSSSARFFGGRFTGTHNGYLLFLLYGGFIGLCLYLWMFASLWREIIPSYQSDYLPSVIAGTTIATFMVAEMVNGATFYMSATTYLAFLVGGAIGYYRMMKIQSLSNADDDEGPSVWVANPLALSNRMNSHN